MSLVRDKYAGVIGYIQNLGAQNVRVEEEGSTLKLWANVQSEDQKNQIWGEIKKIGGDNPGDLIADIRSLGGSSAGSPVGTQTAGGTTGGSRMHTVAPGDTLSKISQQYLGSANRYMDIFNANKGTLSDPNKIQPGQNLIIPNA